MTANFDDAAINEVIDKIVSYALASGRFDSVNGHEPKSAPNNGIVFAVWAQAIRPSAKSGLASTSILVQFQGRIYIPFTQQPYDMIDPQVMAATSELMGAFSGDFNFGGVADVRYVDLLGAEGANMGASGLSAQAGYVEIDRRMFRIMTLNIPVVINDAYDQVVIVVAVTVFSFTNGNGFSGTVTNPTTTPTLVLGTSISGILKGAGNALAQAAAGTDYVAPTGQTFTGPVSPAVFALTDAATVAVDASRGNVGDLTLGGNRTIGVPTNPVNGQVLRFRIRQPASGGPWTPTFSNAAGGYNFGSLSAPTWSTAANACDIIAFEYDLTKTQWMYMGSGLGY